MSPPTSNSWRKPLQVLIKKFLEKFPLHQERDRVERREKGERLGTVPELESGKWRNQKLLRSPQSTHKRRVNAHRDSAAKYKQKLKQEIRVRQDQEGGIAIGIRWLWLRRVVNRVVTPSPRCYSKESIDPYQENVKYFIRWF